MQKVSISDYESDSELKAGVSPLIQDQPAIDFKNDFYLKMEEFLTHVGSLSEKFYEMCSPLHIVAFKVKDKKKMVIEVIDFEGLTQIVSGSTLYIHKDKVYVNLSHITPGNFTVCDTVLNDDLIDTVRIMKLSMDPQLMLADYKAYEHFLNKYDSLQLNLQSASDAYEKASFANLQAGLSGMFSLVNVSLEPEAVDHFTANVSEGIKDSIRDNVGSLGQQSVKVLEETMKNFTATVADKLESVKGTLEEKTSSLHDVFLEKINSFGISTIFSGVSIDDSLISLILNMKPTKMDYLVISLMVSSYQLLKRFGKSGLYASALLIISSVVSNITHDKSESKLHHTTVVTVAVILLYKIYNNSDSDATLQSGSPNLILDLMSQCTTQFASLSTCLNQVVKFTKNCETLTETVSKLKEWFTYAYNSVLGDIFGFPRMSNFSSFNDSAKRFLVLSKEILDDFDGKTLHYTYSNFKKVSELLVSGEEVYSSMKSSREKSHLLSLFSNYLNRIRELRRRMHQMRLEDGGMKIEPVSIQIAGLPGKFKTVLTDFFVSACVGIAGTPDQIEQYKLNRSSAVYVRMTELTHWDNYNENDVLVVIIDDIFQQAEKYSNGGTEATDVIHIVNSNPFMLPQAHLDNKGASSFRAPFFITTTNDISLSTFDSVINREAVSRRFHIRVLPCPKKEYLLESTAQLSPFARKFDLSKIPVITGIMGDESTDIQHYLFDFYKLDHRGKIISGPCSFIDIVESIRVEYRARINRLHRYNEIYYDVAEHVREAIHNNPNRPINTEMFEAYTTSKTSNSTLCSSLILQLKHLVEHDSEGYKEAIKKLKSQSLDIASMSKSNILDFLMSIDTMLLESCYICFRKGLISILDEEFNGKRKCDHGHIVCNVDHEDIAPDIEMEEIFGANTQALRAYSQAADAAIDASRRGEYEPADPANADQFIVMIRTFIDMLDHTNGSPITLAQFLRDLIEAQPFYARYSFVGYRGLNPEKIYHIFQAYRKNPMAIRNYFTDNEMHPDEPYYYPGPITRVKVIKGDFLVGIKEVFKDVSHLINSSVHTILHSNEFAFLRQLVVSYTFMGLCLFAYVKLFAPVKPPKKKISGDSTIQIVLKPKTPEPDSSNVLQGNYHANLYKNNTIKGKRNLNFRQNMEKVRTQVHPNTNLQALSTNPNELARSVINTNMGRFIFSRGDNELRRIGYFFYLNSTHILFPLHFLEMIYWERNASRDESLLFVGSDDMEDYRVEPNDIESWLDSCFDDSEGLINAHVVIGPIVSKREKRCRIKNFFTVEDFNKLTGVFDIQVDLPCSKLVFQSTASLVNVEIGGYHIPKAIEYVGITADGDCGAPIFTLNPRFGARCILGMHFAGSNEARRGYAGLITQEAINEALRSQIVQPSLQGKVEIYPPRECTYLQHFNVLGRVDPSRNHSPYVHKSDIIRSVLYQYGNGISTHDVAMLRVTNGIDPYKKAMEKFVHEIPVWNVNILEKSYLDYRNKLISIHFPANRKVKLSLAAALWGDPLVETWGSIASATSSGFPMKYQPARLNLKKKLMNSRWEEDTPHFKELEKELELFESDARKGKRWLWVFTLNLKNQITKLSKVKSGDNRLFAGAPFLYCVYFRVYFGAFMQFMVENRADNESAVGMNQYSEEWDFMTRKLGRFSSSLYFKAKSCDYSKYDISQRSTILWKILDIVNYWYDDDLSTVRTVLWLDLVNSRHICMDTIFEWFTSLPSGHPFTIFVNGIYGCIALRYAFYSIFEEVEPDIKFNEHVELKVVGDDNIHTCSEYVSNLFTMYNIHKYVSELGLIITLDDKDADINAPDRDITEVTFLKRSFYLDRKLGRWIAPLTLVTIKESPRWSKNNQYYQQIVDDHIVTFFEELSLHPKDVFDELSRDMIKFLRSRRVSTRIFDFDWQSNRSKVLRTPYKVPCIEEYDDTANVLIATAPYAVLQSLGTEYPEMCCDAQFKNDLEHLSSNCSVHIEKSSHIYGYCFSGILNKDQNQCSTVCTNRSRYKLKNGSPNTKNKTNSFPVSLQSSGRLAADAEMVSMTSQVVDDTTHFYNDAEVVEQDIGQITNPYLNNGEVSGSEVKQDIATFLARPRKIASGSFANTDIVSTFTALNVPHDIFANTLIGNKLKGYFGVRYTTVFTLAVNANKFQQGRYMLTAVPMGGIRLNANNGAKWVSSHVATLTQRTQLPRVELDLACDTSATLVLPYNSALDYFPLTALNDPEKYGTSYSVRIFPYQSLASGTGSNTASYSLWVHLEDVELYAAAVPAAGLQAGKAKSKDVTLRELDSQKAGPISSIAFNVSKAATFLEPVPFIGSYATGLSWISDIVGNVAKVFGWSNPTNLEHECRMVRSTMHFANNVDKLDPQLVLGMSSQNKVTVQQDNRLSKLDELDIANFAGRFAYTDTVSWSTGNIEGDELANEAVTATGAVSTIAGTGYTVSIFTPMQWLCSNAQYWRGSIIYKFKIVKTQFHSGRISVAFSPNTSRTTQTPLTYATSDYVYREILDIREKNEYTFAVPFISPTPYKTTYTDLTDSFVGTLKIFVVDPLVAPDTVSNTIQILVEMAAGPDFEIQAPRFQFTTPVYDVVLQAGCEEIPKSLGSSQQNKFQLNTAATCFGERILSLRHLVKRSMALPSVASSTTALKSAVFPTGWVLSGKTGGVWLPPQFNDLYGALCSMFTYNIGGVNIKTMPNDDDVAPGLDGPYVGALLHVPGNHISQLVSFPYGGGFGNYGHNTVKNRFNYGRALLSVNKAAEFSVPNYHFVRKTPNSDGMVTGVYYADAGSLARPYVFSITPDASTDTNMRVVNARSGADDTDFFDFVSVPPMLINSNTDELG